MTRTSYNISKASSDPMTQVVSLASDSMYSVFKEMTDGMDRNAKRSVLMALLDRHYEDTHGNIGYIFMTTDVLSWGKTDED
jgi:hypothetical protein